MLKRIAALVLFAAGCGAGPAARSSGAAPTIGGYAAELGPSEKRTEILVLGMQHLSGVESCLAEGALDRVIARLAAWRPDVIAVESLPGETIEMLSARSDPFSKEVLGGFAVRSLAAGQVAATSLGVAGDAARAELQQGAGDDGAREVMLRLAAHEYATAVLRWTSLAAAARARVPAELAAQLEASSKLANEIYRVAVPLARQLGLTRLAQVDDFAGEEPYTRRFDEFAAEVKASAELAAVKRSPFYAAAQQGLEAACADAAKMEAQVDFLNSEAYGRRDVTLQWGAWFRTHFKSQLDRARLAGWEARNLGIATNLRKESALFPGKRMLVIYGAGHKPFLDAYLGQMLDVRVVQWSELPPSAK